MTLLKIIILEVYTNNIKLEVVRMTNRIEKSRKKNQKRGNKAKTFNLFTFVDGDALQ